MKSLLWIFLLLLIAASCANTKHDAITCTFNDQVINIRNANTTIHIDNNLHFGILYLKNSELHQLTKQSETDPSIFIHDSINEIISFERKATHSGEINDKFGKGQKIKIEALSRDGRIKCFLSLSTYTKIPNVILVQSSFKNISETNYFIQDYILDQISLHSPLKEPEWWSFQGASYHWGDDFVFPLPKSFFRENYMGLNDIKIGGGLPIVDLWNKENGLALAYLGDKPCDISLPVKVENGVTNAGIKEIFKNHILNPGDSLVSIQSAIIVHQNDFYDALRIYSGLMKPLLPEFLKPVEFAYQPEWCTWGYGQHFKPDEIPGKLDRLKALGIQSVIFDDGWSVNHGDWTPDPRKFPDGDAAFKRLINKIHDTGLKVWLWWVPGYTDSTSLLAAQHPDWLIKNKDGHIHPSYGLCPAYQPVQEHYKKLVQKFVEDFKLDGFKLDFGVMNSAPPCYNPKHQHKDPYESFYNTPLLFKNIYETARRYKPDILIEYCSCGIPPTIFHLPWTNLAVTSDPNISQITSRIKLYKALRGDDFPVLEEYCGVLAGPIYQLAIGAGGVPGTFSTQLDSYNEKWLNIYKKYQLSKGEYLNLYDIGFDYPEAHVIKIAHRFYYSFYTHAWKQLGSQERQYRFGTEFDFNLVNPTESEYPTENFSGNVEFRGLDIEKEYKVVDYVNNKELGIVKGDKPNLKVSFNDYLLLELDPLK
jgi:alpha-galactosidase